MNKTKGDKREDVRHPVINFVWYKLLEGTKQGIIESPEGVSQMCDISPAGIGLYVAQDIPIGSLMFLEVILNKMHIGIIGEVAHSRNEKEGYYRVGINFLVIPPNNRLRLHKYLEE